MSVQCKDCAAIEGGPIEGCDYCNITVPYNGRYYTQKSMIGVHFWCRNDEHTCSACGEVVAYDDIVGDGTNRGICCVPEVTIRYYHATDIDNLPSIMNKGILAVPFVYCSTDEETAARWMSFTRSGSKHIITLPFDRKEGDPRMSIGIDHSPLMTQLVGVNDDGSSFTSNEAIPAEDIEFAHIMVYENPHYNEEARNMFDKVAKINAQIVADMEDDSL